MWGWNIGLVVVPSKWVSFQEEGRDGVTGWTCSQWDLLCTAEEFIWLLTKSLSLFNEKPHKHRNLSVWLLPLIDFCANSYQLIKHSPKHLTHPQSKYGHDKKKIKKCMYEGTFGYFTGQLNNQDQRNEYLLRDIKKHTETSSAVFFLFRRSMFIKIKFIQTYNTV